MTLRMLGLYIDDNSISIMNLATGDGKQLTEINLFCFIRICAYSKRSNSLLLPV